MAEGDVWERLQKSCDLSVKDQWRKAKRIEIMKESLEADRRQKVGMLSENPYLAVGDDYVDSSVREARNSRNGSYTFKANVQHLDKPFSEDKPNCIGDNFVDPGRYRRSFVRRNFARRRPATAPKRTKDGDDPPPPPPPPPQPEDDEDLPPAWKPNGGPNLNKPNPYLSLVDADTDASDLKKLATEGKKKVVKRVAIPDEEAEEDALRRRQIITNPIKKGTYGYPGITLGERGNSSIFKYVSCPENNVDLAGRRKAMREAAAAGDEDDQPPAWVPNNGKKTTKWDSCFDRNQVGRFRRFPGKPGTAGGGRRRRKGGDDEDEDELPPWRPSNGKKTTKWDSCISKFTPHMPEPMPVPTYKTRQPAADGEDPPPAWIPNRCVEERVSELELRREGRKEGMPAGDGDDDRLFRLFRRRRRAAAAAAAAARFFNRIPVLQSVSRLTTTAAFFACLLPACLLCFSRSHVYSVPRTMPVRSVVNNKLNLGLYPKKSSWR